MWVGDRVNEFAMKVRRKKDKSSKSCFFADNIFHETFPKIKFGQRFSLIWGMGISQNTNLQNNCHSMLCLKEVELSISIKL